MPRKLLRLKIEITVYFKIRLSYRTLQDEIQIIVVHQLHNIEEEPIMEKIPISFHRKKMPLAQHEKKKT